MTMKILILISEEFDSLNVDIDLNVLDVVYSNSGAIEIDIFVCIKKVLRCV